MKTRFTTFTVTGNGNMKKNEREHITALLNEITEALEKYLATSKETKKLQRYLQKRGIRSGLALMLEGVFEK